jgi:SAM-dependent methyltransferase
MTDRDYRQIVAHYEACLARHGDTHLGVDWPRRDDAETRYAVMLGLIRSGTGPAGAPVSLLDFGCGAGHLYEFIHRNPVGNVRYTGLDLSERFVSLCRSKHPGVEFLQDDILEPGGEPLPRFDYVVANGVFTEKRQLSYDAMLAYFKATVRRLFDLADVGIAFNVMSKHVDWERDDLFHVPFDTLSRFLTGEVTRHFVVRSDYGLYEYTVYAYRGPSSWPGSSSSA